MDREQLNDLIFYCWQFGITTVAELDWWKHLLGIKTNQEMLDKFAYIYNRA